MGAAGMGVAAIGIRLGNNRWCVVVIGKLTWSVMVAERHADARAHRRHALYGHGEGDHQHQQKTLDLDHGAGESYHGSGTPIRYRLFPDSVRSAEFPHRAPAQNVTGLAVAARTLQA